jgi:hypothetical protein
MGRGEGRSVNVILQWLHYRTLGSLPSSRLSVILNLSVCTWNSLFLTVLIIACSSIDPTSASKWLRGKETKTLALRGNRTPGGSTYKSTLMATTQVTTTPLMLQQHVRIYFDIVDLIVQEEQLGDKVY